MSNILIILNFVLQYKNPDKAKRDVLNALTHFGDLRPKPDDFGIIPLFYVYPFLYEWCCVDQICNTCHARHDAFKLTKQLSKLALTIIHYFVNNFCIIRVKQ